MTRTRKRPPGERDAGPPARRQRGFEAAAGLLHERIRAAGEARGFAVTRLLTHWDEIAGAELAAVARPVRIGYGRDGLGATLTLLVEGAHGPMVEMQKPLLRERVNACYGYNAVARIALTQTAAEIPAGAFAEPGAAYAAPRRAAAPAVAADPELDTRARALAEGCRDGGLQAALERLARNVLSRAKTTKG